MKINKERLPSWQTAILVALTTISALALIATWPVAQTAKPSWLTEGNVVVTKGVQGCSREWDDEGIKAWNDYVEKTLGA